METQQQPWQYRVSEWFENHGFEVLFATWPIFFSVCSFFGSDEIARMFFRDDKKWWIQMIATILFIALCLGHVVLVTFFVRRTERISLLRKTNEELVRANERLAAKQEVKALQVKPLIFSYLKSVAINDLDFLKNSGHTGRITVYLHDAAKSAFVPLCRYSNSPELNKFGRHHIPDTEGCLSQVWRTGWLCQSDYPDPVHHQHYVARQAKDGISEQTLNNLRMKPRFYCGCVIWNKSGTRQVGCLMVESTSSNWQASWYTDYVKRHEHGYLSELIDARYDEELSPHHALAVAEPSVSAQKTGSMPNS